MTRPKPGDLALVPDISMGVPFRQIYAVEFDADGEVTSYTLSGLGSFSPGQRVPARAVAAVYPNILERP